jgi:hypothetical protein
MQSLLVNSDKNLIVLQPNPLFNNKLDVKTFYRNEKMFNSRSTSTENILKYYNTLLTNEIELNIEPNQFFTEMDAQSYHEDLDSQSSSETFMHLSLSNNTVKTSRFEFNSVGGFKYRELSNHRFDERILSISSSGLIRTECAVLTETAAFLTSSNSTTKTKIMDGLLPLFKVHNSYWRSIKCSYSQPREYFYSDNTQFLSIDSRYRPASTALFASSSLSNNELIFKTDTIVKNYNYHVICCTETLAIIDDRFPKRCVLSMKHTLKNPCLLMKNIQINDSFDFIVVSDSSEIVINQVSIKTGERLASDNHRLKVDTPKEIKYNLSGSYDHTLDRCLNSRLENSRIVGLSAVYYGNSFYLLQARIYFANYYFFQIYIFTFTIIIIIS